MSKRKNGEGTIYRDKRGLWRGEITIGYSDDGKRIKKQFSSRDLEVVQKRMTDERYMLSHGMTVKSEGYTVGEWVNLWLKTYKLTTVKAVTYDRYESTFRCYILPTIGRIKLDKLTTQAVQLMYNKMFNEGLSLSSIKKARVLLSGAIEHAIDERMISANPVKRAILPRAKVRKARPLTIDEQKSFCDTLGESVLSRFFLIALNTGMRVGELQALTWEDINSDTGMIQVNKTISTVIERSTETNGSSRIRLTGSTKTINSEREIPIGNKVKAILDLQRSVSKYFVFETKTGKALWYTNIREGFEAALKRADIANNDNGLTVHSLRHTFATRLLEKGAGVKAVSELLGHASIQITLDLYGHVFDNYKKSAIALLD